MVLARMAKVSLRCCITCWKYIAISAAKGTSASCSGN
jgi:hypothetical protein